MSIEAMKQMVEALESARSKGILGLGSAITAGYQAIAKEEKQEPAYRCVPYSSVPGEKVSEPVDYYTHPQPTAEQEPVAWEYTTTFIPNPDRDTGVRVTRELRVAEVNALPGSIKPLSYTHPQPKREPLTDDEFISMIDSTGICVDPELAFEIKELVETAHDIKGVA